MLPSHGDVFSHLVIHLLLTGCALCTRHLSRYDKSSLEQSRRESQCMQTDEGVLTGSHGLQLRSWQAVWCWGLLTGSIAQVPACSLLMAVGGGGSHRISGSAAQVPAGSLLLGGSHRISGPATQVPASSPVLRVFTGSAAQVPACSLVLWGGSYRSWDLHLRSWHAVWCWGVLTTSRGLQFRSWMAFSLAGLHFPCNLKHRQL